MRQNDSEGQDTDNKKNNGQIYKMDNMQNSTNTIYKIDNSVCTVMLGVNLKCNKYVLNKKLKCDSVVCLMFIVKCS